LIKIKKTNKWMNLKRCSSLKKLNRQKKHSRLWIKTRIKEMLMTVRICKIPIPDG